MKEEAVKEETILVDVLWVGENPPTEAEKRAIKIHIARNRKLETERVETKLHYVIEEVWSVSCGENINSQIVGELVDKHIHLAYGNFHPSLMAEIFKFERLGADIGHTVDFFALWDMNKNTEWRELIDVVHFATWTEKED